MLSRKLFVWRTWLLVCSLAAVLIPAGTSSLKAASWWDSMRQGRQSESWFYFEYGRGLSGSVTADLHVRYGYSRFTLHDVQLEPEEYGWGKSQIRFFQVLFGSEPGTWDGALTEPYYALRFHFLPASLPNFGIGLEQTHFKTFLTDMNQKIRITGIRSGARMDTTKEVSDIFSLYSISHGVNHLSINLVYRWMLYPDADAPDGQVQPYISLNLGPAIPHHEVLYRENGRTVGKAYEFQPGIQNWGMGFSLGSRFRIFKHFGLYLEYKFSYSTLHGLSFASKTGQGEGEIDTDFTAHHFQFGVSFIL
jgi:hypothetical protein